MPNYITTQFTTSEPILKKGTEIFQVDLSGLIIGSLFKEMAVPCIGNLEVTTRKSRSLTNGKGYGCLL